MSEEKVKLGAPIESSAAEPDYVPPTDLVPLPSRGKVYPPESPLCARETVEIRSMTAKEEDILTSRALLKQGKAMSVLMQSCLTDKKIDVDQLLVGDKNAILVGIRITGYGADYEADVECPACLETFKAEFDLAKLPVKELAVDPMEPGTNAFVFKLPVMKKDVVFKLTTAADENEISVMQDRRRKQLGADAVENNVTARLQYQILSIGGETNKTKLARIIQSLPARDSLGLRLYMDEIAPGIDMTQAVKCPSCGQESDVEVPMGPQFFWPRG